MIYVLILFILVLIIGVLLKKPKPKFISIAIIAENEEAFIRDCLESLKLIPNKEILIGIDTKTIDKTKEICLEYTDKVFDIDWEGDIHFSKARNKVIEKCKGEYIFIIDADEVLKKWDNPKGEYSMVQVNNLNHGIKIPHASVRIFKNGRGYKYSWRVHEKLEPSLAGQYAYANYTIIEHHGYEQTFEEKKKRTEKMLEIHLKQVIEEPRNEAVKYHIARCLHALGQYIEARDFASLALHDNINNEVRAHTCIILYKCLQATQQEDVGAFWLERSLKFCPKQITGRLLLSDYFARKGGVKEALEQLSEIKKIAKNQESRLPNDLLITEEQIEKIERTYRNAI